jgi:hypothetical protein
MRELSETRLIISQFGEGYWMACTAYLYRLSSNSLPTYTKLPFPLTLQPSASHTIADVVGSLPPEYPIIIEGERKKYESEFVYLVESFVL